MLIICFGLLLTWSMATARYGGPDEPAHVLRAASVARGELLGDVVPGMVPGFRGVTVPGPLASGDPACFRHDAFVPAACAGAEAVEGVRRAATSAGTYPPLYYALVGVPVRLVGDPAQVLWYRIVASFWCALALVAAMFRARWFAGRLLIVAALSPAAWFLFGVVNPNSLEIALVLLAWVGVARLRHAPEMSVAELLWFSLPAALAIAIRPIAVLPWIVMMAVLWVDNDTNVAMARAALRLSWRRRFSMFAAPFLAIVGVALWSRWAAVDLNDPREASTLSWYRVASKSVRGSVDSLREMAGSLGWLEYSSPSLTQALWWAVVALGAYATWRRGSRRWRTWMMVLAFVLVSPVVFEVLLAQKIGFVWQGRYSIPIALGLVVLAVDGPLPSRLWVLPTGWAIVGASFALEVATFWYVLRRYTVGLNGSWLFRRAGWNPPTAPFVLLALNGALMAGLVLAVSGFPRQPCDARR